ncbi:hypothetical protein AJ87_42880 [Rhizobium yanglingense]|nr:hypothetical protein AJ87_42880 [Rhizobium yanglingense]
MNRPVVGVNDIGFLPAKKTDQSGDGIKVACCHRASGGAAISGSENRRLHRQILYLTRIQIFCEISVWPMEDDHGPHLGGLKRFNQLDR